MVPKNEQTAFTNGVEREINAGTITNDVTWSGNTITNPYAIMSMARNAGVSEAGRQVLSNIYGWLKAGSLKNNMIASQAAQYQDRVSAGANIVIERDTPTDHDTISKPTDTKDTVGAKNYMSAEEGYWSDTGKIGGYVAMVGGPAETATSYIRTTAASTCQIASCAPGDGNGDYATVGEKQMEYDTPSWGIRVIQGSNVSQRRLTGVGEPWTVEDFNAVYADKDAYDTGYDPYVYFPYRPVDYTADELEWEKNTRVQWISPRYTDLAYYTDHDYSVSPKRYMPLADAIYFDIRGTIYYDWDDDAEEPTNPYGSVGDHTLTINVYEINVVDYQTIASLQGYCAWNMVWPYKEKTFTGLDTSNNDGGTVVVTGTDYRNFGDLGGYRMTYGGELKKLVASQKIVCSQDMDSFRLVVKPSIWTDSYVPTATAGAGTQTGGHVGCLYVCIENGGYSYIGTPTGSDYTHIASVDMNASMVDSGTDFVSLSTYPEEDHVDYIGLGN